MKGMSWVTKGMYWVTKSGVVVMSREKFKRRRTVTGKLNPNETAPCVRVGSGGSHGMLRLDRLRPANRHEVIDAREMYDRKRGRR